LSDGGDAESGNWELELESGSFRQKDYIILNKKGNDNMNFRIEAFRPYKL